MWDIVPDDVCQKLTQRGLLMGMRTVLYDWHVGHGARVVDFGGWDMPVQYTTIMDEHTAVRTGVGVFDVSHMGRLSFGGPDTLALIQRVFTNNAATMKDMQVRYGLIGNDRGGIRDDVLVYKWPGVCLPAPGRRAATASCPGAAVPGRAGRRTRPCPS